MNPLRINNLSGTITAVTLGERVRLLLREEKARKKLSEREMADLIQWTQSRVAQKLSGRTPITLDELESLCFALGLSPTEAVRDRGLEFCAEMTPSELRLLERLRQLPRPALDGIMAILQIAPASVERRGVTAPKKILGTPRGK